MTLQACRTETRQLLQNIPSEECDLEPVEECAMETVLVPRLVEKPKCIKVNIIVSFIKSNPVLSRCQGKFASTNGSTPRR